MKIFYTKTKCSNSVLSVGKKLVFVYSYKNTNRKLTLAVENPHIHPKVKTFFEQ